MNLVKFDVIYKSLSVREGGEFTNERNQVVKYEPTFVIQFDENLDGKIIERRLKFPFTNKNLEKKIRDLQSYSKIKLVCSVQLYDNGAKVTPIDVE